MSLNHRHNAPNIMNICQDINGTAFAQQMIQIGLKMMDSALSAHGVVLWDQTTMLLHIVPERFPVLRDCPMSVVLANACIRRLVCSLRERHSRTMNHSWAWVFALFAGAKKISSQ